MWNMRTIQKYERAKSIIHASHTTTNVTSAAIEPHSQRMNERESKTVRWALVKCVLCCEWMYGRLFCANPIDCAPYCVLRGAAWVRISHFTYAFFFSVCCVASEWIRRGTRRNVHHTHQNTRQRNTHNHSFVAGWMNGIHSRLGEDENTRISTQFLSGISSDAQWTQWICIVSARLDVCLAFIVF